MKENDFWEDEVRPQNLQEDAKAGQPNRGGLTINKGGKLDNSQKKKLRQGQLQELLRGE